MKNIEELVELGKKILKNDVHYKELPEDNAIYMWENIRGGIAIIIGEDKSYLTATSSVNFERHLNEYRRGRRNSDKFTYTDSSEIEVADSMCGFCTHYNNGQYSDVCPMDLIEDIKKAKIICPKFEKTPDDFPFM